MNILYTHIVVHPGEHNRLGDYLVGKSMHLPSRKSVKKAIDRGQVLVNGHTGSTGLRVQAGDRIDILEAITPLPKVYDLSIPIVYEDDYLAILNKPSGIPVSGNQFRTVQQALPANLTPSSFPDALQIPRPVHRLDAATSGLLLIAKTANAAVKLGQLFEKRAVAKNYEAIVIGNMPDSGTLTFPIEGLEAITDFRCIGRVPSLCNEWLSWLELYPKTGRTHQLRIHLSKSGHPIMGDKIYGTPGQVYLGKGLFLCATALAFTHPLTREGLEIRIAPPNKFHLLMDREQRRREAYRND